MKKQLKKSHRKARIASLFFLVLFLHNTFYPTAAWALTSGPDMPQYSSFEQFDVSNMVNPLTGDFNYNLPVMSVPVGNGQVYPINMFYNAGVLTNQEASYVGLGWNLNVGSISRSVVGYPDDYKKEINTKYRTNLSSGYRVPQTYQLSYNKGAYLMGFDASIGVPTQVGTFSLSLGVRKNVYTGIRNMDHLGFGYTAPGGGFSVGFRLGSNMGLNAGVGYKGVGVSASTYGGDNQLSIGYNNPKYTSMGSVGVSLSSKGNHGVSYGPFSSRMGSGTDGTSNVQANASDWTFVNNSGGGGLADPQGSGFINYNSINIRHYLDKSVPIAPYGALYLGHYQKTLTTPNVEPLTFTSPFDEFTAPAGTDDPAVTYGDMDMADDLNVWANNSNPDKSTSNIAYDFYNVNAPGIVGSIRPYIFENGSLQGITQTHQNYAQMSSFSSSTEIDAGNMTESRLSTNSKETPFKFRYTDEFASNLEMEGGSVSFTNSNYTNSQSLTASSSTFYNKPGDDPAKGYKNKYLKGKRFVEWFTEMELKYGLGAYGDNLHHPEKVVMNANQYFTNVANGDGVVPNFNFSMDNQLTVLSNYTDGVKIRAFKITAEDGMVYHFGLPVHAMNEASLYFPGKLGNGQINNDGPNYACVIKERKTPYAYAWLLTAITGPDFVDENENGVTDEGDHGYWIKFDYGKWTDDYKWQAPYYFGYEHDLYELTKTKSHGQKQIYYLNKIVTRTHTAAFVYNDRLDSKGADVNNSNVRANQLRLEQIRLYTSKDFNELEANYAQGSLITQSGNHGDTKHNYNRVYDVGDFSASTSLQNEAANRLLKMVLMDYSYDLCKETNGSSAPNRGKLTLTKVDLLGLKGAKVFPSYKFDYDANNPTANPNYHQEKFDRWGYYKSDIDANVTNRYVTSTSKNQLDAWSLRKITLPTGGTIEMKYEADSYSRIGNKPFGYKDYFEPGPHHFFKSAGHFNYPIGSCEELNAGTIDINSPTLLNTLKYYFDHNLPVIVDCYGPGCSAKDFSSGCCIDYAGLTTGDIFVKIMVLAGNRLILNTEDLPKVNYFSDLYGRTPVFKFTFPAIYAGAQPDITYGGGIRVKEIISKDETNKIHKVAYDYSYDANFSSGFTAIEPPHYEVLKPVLSWYAADPTKSTYDGPTAGVMYSKVTIKQTKPDNTDPINITELNYQEYDPELHYNVSTTANTAYTRRIIIKNALSDVGRMKSSKTIDTKGNLLQKVEYEYDTPKLDQNYQGVIKDVVHRVKEHFQKQVIDLGNGNFDISNQPVSYGWRAYVKENYKLPTVLKSIKTTTKDIVTYTKNKSYDFYTGMTTSIYSDNGISSKTIATNTYAYAKSPYAEMGSKVDNINNKNMLTQQTANYVYAANANESADKLLNASVQTWNKEWRYRKYSEDQSNSHYAFYTGVPEQDVWRTHKTYIWKSNVGNEGEIPASSFVDFVWNSNTQHAGWQNTSEIEMYDRYSTPLQTRDINNNRNAIRAGYNNRFIIASATNSNYYSFTYSGFEDLNTSLDYKQFGGEVYINEGSVLSDPLYVHTGNKSVGIPASKIGPIFKTKYIHNDPGASMQRGTKYRASVWVYNSSTTSAELKVELNGTITNSSIYNASNSMSTSDPRAIVAGNWKLLFVDIDVPADYISSGVLNGNNDVRVYVKNNSSSSSVIIDDMRFHPVTSQMASYVYDERTGNLIASLDNENFATKFHYDEAGRLVRMEKETTSGFKPVSATKYNYGGN